MKLFINSNKHYMKPLKIALKSLKASGFTKWEDVIVSISGASADEDPLVEDNFLGLGVKIVSLKSVKENYDYQGYTNLRRHRNHPLVLDDSYFYTLDTVVFTSDFPKIFSGVKVKPGEVISCALPNSNVSIFGKNMIDKYNSIYDTPLSKPEAVAIECGRHEVPHLTSLAGECTWVEGRVRVDAVDIYETGKPRKAFLYKFFGLIKYILWADDGDIKGDYFKNT